LGKKIFFLCYALFLLSRLEASEKVNFRAFLTDGKVYLKWEKVQHFKVDRYILLRRVGEGEEMLMGRIDASEESAVSSYLFIDGYGRAQGKTLHYKLIALSLSGKELFVSRLSVGAKEEAIWMRPFPNPAKDQVRVKLSLPHPSDLRLRLSDARGRILWEKDYPRSSSELVLNLSLEERERGLYRLACFFEGKYISRSLLLE